MAAGMYPTREHMDEQRRLENCRGHLYRRIATLEQQVAALIEERNQEHSMACEIHAANLEIRYELAAAQARESKRREALTAIRGGHCISTFLCADEALASPTDNSALMEQLKQERERCAEFCEAYDKYDYAAMGLKTLADAIRGLA